METVIITGGTGLIGTHLSERLLENGYKVVALTRQIPRDDKRNPNIKYIKWDLEKDMPDNPAIREASHIIHLAGAGIFERRWTTAYKKTIFESRTKSSNMLIRYLQENNHNIKTFISSSAIGWYGDDNRKDTNIPFREDAPPGNSFLSGVCKQWEEIVWPASTIAIRLVILRTGIVISKRGGAFPKLTKPLQYKALLIPGTGNQIVSWIHINDLCSIFLSAIQNEKIQGVFNAVAPQPVSMQSLLVQTKEKQSKKTLLTFYLPARLLKIMLGERSIEILKSVTVSADKIKSVGFIFQYPSIKTALKEILSK